MSHLIELEHPGHEELIFPCDCHDGDYLRITWDEDPEWRFLWVETWSHHQSVWARVRGAWRLLRGHGWQHSEIVLSPYVVEKLMAFLVRRGRRSELEIPGFTFVGRDFRNVPMFVVEREQ